MWISSRGSGSPGVGTSLARIENPPDTHQLSNVNENPLVTNENYASNGEMKWNCGESEKEVVAFHLIDS